MNTHKPAAAAGGSTQSAWVTGLMCLLWAALGAVVTYHVMAARDRPLHWANQPHSAKATGTQPALDRAGEPGQDSLRRQGSADTAAANDDPTDIQRAPIALPAQSSSAAAANLPQALLIRLLAAPALAVTAVDDPEQELLTHLRQNLPFRLDVMDRYRTEPDPASRDKLATLLATLPPEEMAAYTQQLLSQTNPEQRRRGLQLLVASQDANPEARSQLLSALHSEVDPAALSLVLNGLSPGQVREPQVTSAVLGQLRHLANHLDAEVRAAAVSTTAQWGQTAAESAVVQALSDAQPGVVQSAIETAATARLGSTAVVESLLQLAERSDASAANRQRALDALASLHLDPARFARYARLVNRPQ